MEESKKLKLEDLKVQSFVTELNPSSNQTIKGGLTTGNCGSFINITCPEPCDFQSIPITECTGTLSLAIQ
jgi:hypothetical protein